MSHGGNRLRLAAAAGTSVKDILDFSANINPLGPPPWLRGLISARVGDLVHYPDPDCTELRDAAARRYGADRDEILTGNGSSEILYRIVRTLGQRPMVPVPSYIDYVRACALADKPVFSLHLSEERGFEIDMDALSDALRNQGGDMVLIGQPNNPTGVVGDPEAIRECARRHPNVVFVVDEAFADFVGGLDRLTRRRPANLIVLLSLTKNFAIPGLRLGCAVADAALVRQLRARQIPWSVNALAQAVGTAALADSDYIQRTVQYVDRQRAFLRQSLEKLGGYTVYPGRANFLLVRIDRSGGSAAALARRLIERSIAIRVCTDFEGLDDRYFRIAVRTEEENQKLCEALADRPVRLVKRRRPALMFQGTGSNAGKSVLTAAFCRILLQDGFRVAPFKAQNMSLNSYVTREGGEMGRAQVVQAQACRIEPDTRMNPVLLKPNSDTGSQVILRGKPAGCMNVEEYIRFKPEAARIAQAAYDSLARDYNVIVLEGAGSPGEVNLKSHDIVNMIMARHAGAPVLLVGDIDRGGVFASFVGTMEVLEEWERALVGGFIVNRFRGRESLLRDALEYVERHSGRPVLGVVPFLSALGLPEEDSVAFKDMISPCMEREMPGTFRDGVDVALIDLPHISNFTDFDALRNEPDVRLRVVRAPGEMGMPDAVLIPGSKNVLEDLEYLRRAGLDRSILEQARRAEIVGICGGYQMLGTRIEDAGEVESSRREARGLGLLELATTMAAEKTLQRVTARHVSGHRLQGYEIHHGQSEGPGLEPLVWGADSRVIGSGRDRIWGTYLHGLFDADDFRRWFVDRLRRRRGLEPIGRTPAPYDLEPALDRLADVMRRSIRLDAIYSLMGLR